MENGRNFPARQLHSLALFAGLCIGITPVAQVLAVEGQTDTDDMLVVGASTPSLYVPQQSADPKFSRPVADTTCTTTVISEQVTKDQGATNLTDALKNVPGVGAFFAGENGNSTTGDAIYIRGADTSNSIYIDSIRDIGSVSYDIFNIEQVRVAKGPSSTDYGRSTPTGPINMISEQPYNNSGVDASASTGSAWFRCGTLDVNQVIGDTTAVRLDVMGERTHDVGCDKVKNERYGVAPSVAFGLSTANRLYLNYLYVTQHNTSDGGIPAIGLPGYSIPPAGTAALNHSGRVDTHNFYGTDSDYDDPTTNTAAMRFEHDINDNITVRNTTHWSRVKQDYLTTAVIGGASNITQSTSDMNSWTWSCTANTKNVNSEILTNQINPASTFYTGSIGHDVGTGVEFTRETQASYGVNPATLSAVNIYHPDGSIHPDGLTRNGTNANGQTDIFATYVFDTLQITHDFELNGGIRLDNHHTEYDSATAYGGNGCGAITRPTGVAKGSPVTTVDIAKPGNPMNWKTGTLYHLTENGNAYINYAVSQRPSGGNNFALAQSDSGDSANHTDFKLQKANTSEIGTKWQVLDKRLLFIAALFRTDIENEAEQNDDGTYSQYGKRRVEGYEISVVGNITPAWQVIGDYTQKKATVKNGKDVAQDGSPSLPYTPGYAFTLWSQYQATDDISVGVGACYIGSMHKGSDGVVGTSALIEGYWVADAKLGYRVNRNPDSQLNVYNLFDADYVASVNKSGYRYHPGEPRTFLLTANMHF